MDDNDYAMIAEAIQNTKIMFPQNTKALFWLTTYLAQLFAWDNTKFNKQKFLKYCGFEGIIKG